MENLLQEKKELEERLDLIDKLLKLEDDSVVYEVEIEEIEENHLAGTMVNVYDEDFKIVYHSKVLFSEEFDTESLHNVLSKEIY